MRQTTSGLAFLTLCIIGCPSGGEQSLAPSDSSDVVAEQPEPITDPVEPRYEFDGTWHLDTTYTPGQAITGTDIHRFFVEIGRPTCVRPSGPDEEWRDADGGRPVTMNDDILEIRFRYDFAPNSFEDFSVFDGEGLVELSIVGERIDTVVLSDGQLLSADYDVTVIEHYIHTGTILTASGNLSWVKWIFPEPDCNFLLPH